MNFQSSLITPPLTERTWRDDVMDESTAGFGWGEYDKAFLQAICRAQPQLATCAVYLDRERTLEFLKQQCTNVTWMLSSQHVTVFDGVARPHIGWYQLEWENNHLELALIIGHSNQDVYGIGDDVEVLEQFAQTIQNFADAPSGRCLRYAEGWENAPELDEEMGRVTWDDITLKPEIMARLRESVEGFAASRDTMHEFGFPWKRGILLVGPPGTGKTMVCKAAATALPDIPFLYVRDLRENDQKESIEAIFKRARRLAPCILSFEDLDGFVNDSNRTVFLNEMDGFASNEGLLIIASSNHPGKIDEALLKRPSRFDRVFHLGLPELSERRSFCEKILTRESLAQKLAPDLNIAALCEQVAQKSDGFTPAYLKEVFVSAALSRAQDGATLLDEHFASAVMEQLAELKAHLKKTKNPDALADMRASDDTIGFRR